MRDGDEDGRWEKFLFLQDESMRCRKLARESFGKRKEVVYKYGGLQSILKFNDGYQQ
jgi:hypothetical protein